MADVPVIEAPALELPLPEIPAAIQQPEDRMAFVVEHFWDTLDFNDPARALDTAFMEQNFVNFVSFMEMAPDEGRQRAMTILLSRAKESDNSFAFLRSIIERYLDDPNSPMRNEEQYIVYLREVLNGDYLGESDRLRVEHRLNDALKNRPGTVATDFKITLRDGTKSTLHEQLKQASKMTIVVFYDPDCEQCHRIIERLANTPAAEGVRILAIDAEEDRDRWNVTKQQLPEEWTVAFADTPILDQELYTLPASPTIYLIAPDLHVKVKDANLF